MYKFQDGPTRCVCLSLPVLMLRVVLLKRVSMYVCMYDGVRHICTLTEKLDVAENFVVIYVYIIPGHTGNLSGYHVFNL